MPASVQLAVRIAASVAARGIQRCIDHLLTRPLSHTAAVNVRLKRDGPALSVKIGVKGGDITHTVKPTSGLPMHMGLCR